MLDLDSAILQSLSGSRSFGSLRYLAPEATSLEQEQEIEPNALDVWALGLAMWAFYTDRAFGWDEHDPSAGYGSTSHQVSEALYLRLHQNLDALTADVLLPGWIKEMTE